MTPSKLLAALMTQRVVGGVGSVAAVSGVLDADGVNQALERINQSIAKFSARHPERSAGA